MPDTLRRAVGDARLHDRDWYAWTQDQAARLRAWPEHLRPNGLDIEQLAEEVEDMGGSQRQAVVSFLRLIALHALKLEFHPVAAHRAHWMSEIDAFRDSLDEHLVASPSLRARRAELYAAAWAKAARSFRRQLEREAPAEARAVAPLLATEAPRYDLDTQLLNEDWYPVPSQG